MTLALTHDGEPVTHDGAAVTNHDPPPPPVLHFVARNRRTDFVARLRKTDFTAGEVS